MGFAVDSINIVLILATVLNVASAGFVVFKNRSRSGGFFGLLAVLVGFWGLAMFWYRLLSDPEEALVAAKLLYVSAALIPLAFLFFVAEFAEQKLRKLYAIISILPAVTISLLSIFPGFLILSVSIPSGSEHIIHFNVWWHFVYAMYIVSYFAISYILLAKAYLATRNREMRLRLFSIFLGTFVSTSIGVTTNLLLLFLGNFNYNWLGQAGTVFMVGAIAYAIIKHRLFDTRVVAAELLVFAIWMMFLLRTLLSSGEADQLLNIVFLVLSLALGVFVIRSVTREVESREQLERLANDLSDANSRLRELDTMKSEFVSVASHQLRSPLTAIKGYSSLLLEGSFGEVPQAFKEPIDRIFQASRSMAGLIEDFLNISRIEQGRMKYQFGAVELYALISNVIREFIPNVVRAGLLMEFTAESTRKHTVWGDADKLRQVFGNLLDNAIKYTKRGRIMITLKADEKRGTYIISLLDTGIGIPPETIPKLFEKFNRSENANNISVSGTGLGLYVAKEMVRAHHGEIWVESPGVGKGSTFFVELKMAKPSDAANSTTTAEFNAHHSQKIAEFAKQM